MNGEQLIKQIVESDDLMLSIDPGTATPEEIEELTSAIQDLRRLLGKTPVKFVRRPDGE